MRPLLEELARDQTPDGLVTLRRRWEPAREVDVYEVKLGDEWLMSSLFTAGEVALGRLGLAPLEGDDLDVVVGGLGLGYTAGAVLDDDRVRSLVVVEAVDAVIGWHADGLLPEVPDLGADDRTRMVPGDFFVLAAGTDGFDPDQPGRRFDAVLLDVDHTPRHHLAPRNAAFYTREGLTALRRHLVDGDGENEGTGGVFGLWSDDPPDDEFTAVLGEVFDTWDAHEVAFPNFYTGGESTNTVYVAR